MLSIALHKSFCMRIQAGLIDQLWLFQKKNTAKHSQIVYMGLNKSEATTWVASNHLTSHLMRNTQIEMCEINRLYSSIIAPNHKQQENEDDRMLTNNLLDIQMRNKKRRTSFMAKGRSGQVLGTRRSLHGVQAAGVRRSFYGGNFMGKRKSIVDQKSQIDEDEDNSIGTDYSDDDMGMVV